MIIKYKVAILSILLSFILTITASSQKKVDTSFRSFASRCESICVFLDPYSPETNSSDFTSNAVLKVGATLVNNTSDSIKVRASGSDRLFYEAMSDFETVKKRYDCHVCYFRKVKPRSSVRFEIYADDLRNIFAIRMRYSYAWEEDESDELIHYVSWINSR